MADDRQVQTRSNDGMLKYWPSIKEAFTEADKDSSIWKISWTNADTDERIRLVRRNGLMPNRNRFVKTDDVWVYEPIVFPEIPDLEPNYPQLT